MTAVPARWEVGDKNRGWEIFSKFVDSHRFTLKEIKKNESRTKNTIGLTLEKGGDRWSGKNGRR